MDAHRRLSRAQLAGGCTVLLFGAFLLVFAAFAVVEAVVVGVFFCGVLRSLAVAAGIGILRRRPSGRQKSRRVRLWVPPRVPRPPAGRRRCGRRVPRWCVRRSKRRNRRGPPNTCTGRAGLCVGLPGSRLVGERRRGQTIEAVGSADRNRARRLTERPISRSADQVSRKGGAVFWHDALLRRRRGAGSSGDIT